MNEDYWSMHLNLDKKQLLAAIKKESETLQKPVSFMEVCGGHTNTIMRYGIRSILPDNISLLSGPGCPVCVTAQEDIDAVIELAMKGIPVATYGDMLRVPGTKMSLEKARAKGASVHMVYSSAEVLKLKEKFPDIVFFGIGFETTTPMSAFLLEHNVPVYSTHKLIAPGMNALLDENIAIDGFILPGHVSVITGLEEFKKIKVPQAVCGFEPEHLLRGIYALVRMINENKKNLVNTYPEAVRSRGNEKATALIAKHFVLQDSVWRGIGVIPGSGFEVKSDSLNAKKIHANYLKDLKSQENNGCRCGEVLKGLIKPTECELFSKVCTPDSPQGACMVSSEGACQIYYNFREN